MKTYISSIIALFTLILMSVCPFQANAFTYLGVNYLKDDTTETATVASNESATGDIVIPDQVEYNGYKYTVTEIESRAFSSANITSIKLPESIESIGSEAFRDTKLTELVIPNSVKAINSRCFADCSKLEVLQLGKKVRTIWGDIFSGLSSLKVVISLNPTPPTVEDTSGPTTTEAALYVPKSAMSAYSSTGIWKDFTRIYTTDDLPPVLSETSAFTNLSLLTVGNSVKKISPLVFWKCNLLSSLILGSGLEEIGEQSFAECQSLEEVVLPPAVENIGALAFANCGKLDNIIMGANVKTIGEKAFDGCPAKKIYITAQTPPLAPNTTFSNYSGNLYLQGEKTIDVYYDAYTCWDRFNGYAMIEATDIAMDKKPIAGKPGNKITLKATVQPEDVTLPQIYWYSTNPEVATVDPYGVVTIISPLSEALILAEGEDDANTCKIIARTLYADGPVAEVEIHRTEGLSEAESIILNVESLSLIVGDTAQLTATILPEDAADKSIVWTSSNEEVATVDATGLVTALTKGSAVITAKSATPGVQATCHVTVNDQSGIESILIDADRRVNVYNLQGQLIKREATAEDMKTLEPGLYIIDAKKVMIK